MGAARMKRRSLSGARSSETSFLLMANIPFQQNAPEHLLPFRASRHLYARAKWFAGVQVVSTVCVPTAGAFLSLWLPGVRPYVALYGLVVALLDACVLDRLQKGTTKQAARI